MKLKLPQDSKFNVVKYGDLSKPRSDLLKYIIENKSKVDFTFEFRYSKDVVPVFITGTELEKELPMVRFPLVVTTNDVSYIVSNLVGAVRSNIENGLIKDKRTDYVDYEVCRNVLVYNTLKDKDLSFLITIASQLATFWIKDVLTKNFRLDIFESNDIEGAIFYYFLVNFIPDITTDGIKQKFLNNLSIAYNNNINSVNIIVDKLKTLDKSTATLEQYIHLVASTETMKAIELVNISTLLGNKWFSGSNGSQFDIFSSLDNVHTLMAIMYHSLNTVTGTKTALGRFLKDNKRMLKIDSFLSGIENLIKDVTIR